MAEKKNRALSRASSTTDIDHAPGRLAFLLAEASKEFDDKSLGALLLNSCIEDRRAQLFGLSEEVVIDNLMNGAPDEFSERMCLVLSEMEADNPQRPEDAAAAKAIREAARGNFPEAGQWLRSWMRREAAFAKALEQVGHNRGVRVQSSRTANKMKTATKANRNLEIMRRAEELRKTKNERSIPGILEKEAPKRKWFNDQGAPLGSRQLKRIITSKSR